MLSVTSQVIGVPAAVPSVMLPLLSTVCAVVLYIALRPALEKAHLLPKE